MVIAGIIVGLIILVLLVVVHELGHALVAKRNGVEVEEFGIGFPPAAKTWQPKQSFLGQNVTFSLNWLPLGGFVRLKGEHDSARGAGTYGQASFWIKTKILLAGVTMNWLVAALLFTILALVGLPKVLPHQVSLPFDTVVDRSPLQVAQVADQSPAQRAGLKVGDQITQIDQQSVATATELSAATKAVAGRTVPVKYQRHGTEHTTMATLNDEQQAAGAGYLGVGSQQSEQLRATYAAPLLGLATTGQLTIETLKGVGDLLVRATTGFIGQFSGSEQVKQQAKANLDAAAGSVAGPVGILGVLFPSVLSSGPQQVILLAAVISLTLAVMNILPIPALDGGRWFTMTGFRLCRQKLTKQREEAIQTIGFVVLLVLTIMVTWSDVGKLFS